MILPETHDNQLANLQIHFDQFINTLENMEPEKVDLDDIDRLIRLINELDEKCQQMKSDE